SRDSDNALETVFVAVGVLATLNLDFTTIEVAPKFLDLTATHNEQHIFHEKA
ncbi:hypothetical protein Tco_1021178, partial [Tanacetum coccineum]